jgi:NCS1 family nucleobase:cation symporter-1
MSRRTAVEEDVEREGTFGILPVLRHERVWSFADFSWVNIGLAIATWAFLTGGATAAFVGAKAGIAAMIIGNAIGIAIVCLATCVPSGKYGVEQYTIMRSMLGRNTTRAIVFTFLLAVEMGWTAVLSIMFARATSNVSNEALGTSIGPNSLVVTLFALVAIVLSWLVLSRGPVTIKFLNKIVAPGLALITLGMLALIFTDVSWGELTAAKPLSPFDDPRVNFMIAVEFNVATGLSWWPVMGGLARLTQTPRAAYWPNMIGIFGATVVAQIVGMFAALTLGDADPTVWMIPLGGTVLGIVALIFIAFANVTSIVAIIYATCLALRQAGGQTLSRVSWPLLSAGFFVLPALLVFVPGTLYDNFLKFVVWGAAVIAPLTGIMVADYFLLRRRHIDIRALYDDDPSSTYGFWHHFNPAGIAALIAGFLVYLLILNPQTLESRGAFELFTASIPSLVVGAGVHVVLTKLIVQPLGWGGYGAQRRRVPERGAVRA